MSRARRVVLVVASGLLLALPAAARGADTTVSIQGSVFRPGDVSVTVGESVTFINKDGYFHDAAAMDGAWTTPQLGDGDEATITFETAGTYEYWCSIHPPMRGTVTVLAAPAPPDTSTAPAGSGNRQDGPNGVVLIVAGVIGLLVAMRRFRTASAR